MTPSQDYPAVAVFPGKNIMTAVSGSSVISKIIEMEADLQVWKRISYPSDADQYIPYPLSEVNLDFSDRAFSHAWYV